MTDKMSTETIYGTIQEQESHVMSERVQSLAATVYKEFEKVIKRYDEDVVKDLMPLVVGILESLDAAFTEKQELDVEIELLREDNEQLLTQYEREKQLRKSADQKYLELEDNVDGTKKELEDKVETLESLLRMSEIKSKNSADHVSRLEEKENESKGEYTKLHERYTELFRTHMDYMERTKILMGTDKLSELTSNSPRVNKGFHLPGLRPVSVAYGGMMEFGNRFDNSRDSTPLGFDSASTPQGNNLNLKNELGNVEPVDHIEPKEVREKTIGTNIPSTSSTTQESTTTTITTTTTTTSTSATNNAHVSNPKPSVIEGEGERDKISEDRKEQKTNVGENESVEETKVVMRKKKRKSEETMKFEDSMSFEEDPMPGLNETLASIVATTPELEDSQDSLVSQEEIQGKRKSVRNDNSIFEELSIQGTDMIAEVDFGADITDSDDNAGEEENDEDDDKENDKDSVGDNFFGMGKELENLILENTELLATKNALNIVKDDLIAKVDELSSEQEILREEITSLQAVRGRLQLRITQLEEELKKIKEENDKKKEENHEKGEDESDVPMAQRKRFTRVEMARVLMERNQYKERLMELQEAVRWTEMIRASREHPGELQPKKKSTVWNFFSELVAPSSTAPSTTATTTTTPSKQIPVRHQNILQAVLNNSHTNPSSSMSSSFSSSSMSEPIPPSCTASLIPSPTSCNGPNSLAKVTIVPRPTPPTPVLGSGDGAHPVPIVLHQIPKLPPTPSGAPAPRLSPSLLPASPLPPPTSSLPGIHTKVEADHEVKHL